MTAPFLILAVGNESRGDDALGPLLLRRIADWLPSCWLADEVELIEEFQLQVENTLDIKDRELVLFIDAGMDASIPFSFYEVAKKRLETHTSHAVEPAMLLGIYRMVHDADPPPTFILCVAGYAFELGAPLSPQAGSNLDEAFDFACRLFDQPRLLAWRKLAHARAVANELAIPEVCTGIS